MTTVASAYGASGAYTIYGSKNNATTSNAGSAATSGSKDSSSSNTTKEKASAESIKLSARFDRLVKIISERKGNSLSFSDLRDEADKLEDEFDKQVKADLKALGVDTDETFQLRYDEKTGKMVCSKHPDKEKIEEYFNSHSDRVSQFQDIVDLRAITQYSQSSMSPQLFQQKMDYLSMSIWMETMDSGFTGTMSMNSFGSSVYQGLNLQV